MADDSRNRREAWQDAASGTFDVVVIGAGVTGAALFRELQARGLRVLLVDSGDFASGTSQASGMLVWGGLLYLRKLDLLTVRKLCRDRDRLLEALPGELEVARFRYLPLRSAGQLAGRSARFVRAALEAYWWIGGRRRRRPYRDASFPELGMLRPERFGPSLVYEEASLVASDARLVLDWILGARSGRSTALNYCSASALRDEGGWRVHLEDTATGARGGASGGASGGSSGRARAEARARLIVNAAGVWAERVAEACGIRTRHRHVLSHGVYLGIEREPCHRDSLVFEMGAHGDVLTLTPWGPIALFGPTEKAIESIEAGAAPALDDVRFLLDHMRSNLSSAPGAGDIVSLRSGIRPLAVDRSYSGSRYPLDLSRRHAIDVDRDRHAITVFGGKLTSARSVARSVAVRVERHLRGHAPPRASHLVEPSLRPAAHSPAPHPTYSFEAHRQVPLIDPAWSRDHEACLSLFDYLRRRTNIAQWTPRLGLGRANEHRAAMLELAGVFHGAEGAEAAVDELARRADAQDRLIGGV